MADKFDWKKVLKTPFSRQEDRSAEVLFLPTEEAGRPTASFDTLSSRTTPQPGPAIEPEPVKEYVPPAPLVLPPSEAVSAWGEDAFAPSELQQLSQKGDVAGSIPPVMDEVEEAPATAIEAPEPGSPELLTPIQVSGWQTPAAPIAPIESTPVEEPAFDAPSPVDPIEIPATVEAVAQHPSPVEAPAVTGEAIEDATAESAAKARAQHSQQTDDLLARFGVQRAVQKPHSPAEATAAPNELLHNLERLLSGLPADAAPSEVEAPAAVQQDPVDAHPDLAELLQRLNPAPEVEHDTEARVTAPDEEPKPEPAPTATHESIEPVEVRPEEGQAEELSRGEPTFEWAKLLDKEAVPETSPERELPSWSLESKDEEPQQEPGEAFASHLIEAEPHAALYLAPAESAPEVQTEPEAATSATPAAEAVAATDEPDPHKHFDLAAVLASAAAKRGTDFVRIGPIKETCPVWFRTEGHFEHIHDFSTEEGMGIRAWFVTHAKDGCFEYLDDTIVTVGYARDADGEMLTARFGKSQSGPHELAALGLEAAEAKSIASAAKAPHGIIVVSAPAGQTIRPIVEGIVSCWTKGPRQIGWLGLPPADHEANILSAQAGEKPEDGLAGLIAAEADCIAIDNLDRASLADLASQAVIKGRLVCVGLTAADGWSALARLTDFGVSPYLMSSAIRGIVSSRTVRALCPHCKQSEALTHEQNERALAVGPEALLGHVCAPQGCDECHGTGYSGTITLYEVVRVDEEASRLIALRSGPASFRAHFSRAGQRSMAQAALDAVLAGKTSWVEVEGIIGG